MRFQNPYRFEIVDAQNPLDFPSRWCAIDVETGGLDPTKNALLQIAVHAPGEGTRSFFVRNSPGLVEQSALEINRLDLDEVRNSGLTIEDARTLFLRWTQGRAIVGQNIAFDLGFIASRLFNISPRDDALELFGAFKIFDTNRVFRQLHPKEEAPKADLASIATFYGLEFDRSACHDAAFDAVLTALVFQKELAEIVDRNAERS